MPDLLRQEIATAAHTIIVKVGTRVLTAPGGTLNQQRVAELAEELHQVIATNRKVDQEILDVAAGILDTIEYKASGIS